MEVYLFRRNEYLIFSLFLIFFVSESFGITTEALKAPMGDFKKEIWGWLHGVQIIGVAAGAGFAIVKQSLVPFGVGGGISAAIHFFDKFIGDGSAALI
jgi:hypothetical protein